MKRTPLVQKTPMPRPTKPMRQVSPTKLAEGLHLHGSTLTSKAGLARTAFKAKPKNPARKQLPMPRPPWVEAPEQPAEKVRKAKATAKRLGPTPKTVALVIERDGSSCIICGIGLVCVPELRGITHHVHHLQFKSRGGHHRASNLALLCPSCHDRVHLGNQKEAEGNGWSQLAGRKPGQRVLINTPDGKRYAKFHDNGTRTILKTRVRAGVTV